MKYFINILTLVILLIAFISIPYFLYAQKSTTEVITTIPPPVIDGNIQVNDGARQIYLFDHYLLITNYWAGLHLYDISDIQNPRQVAFTQSNDDGYYTYVEGNYAYFASHGAGVQVYKLPQLSKTAQIKTPGNAYWVYAEYPYLFTAHGSDGFSIMDITDSQKPISLTLEIPGYWIQQLFKKENLLFVAAKKGGMIIYDISNLEAPRKISQYKTGYDVIMIDVVDDIAYIADGGGGFVTMNVSNPEIPKFINRFSTGGYVNNLCKAGNYVYLTNQSKGLQIVNVSDLENPFLEGSYETESKAYAVSKREIYVFLVANTSTLIMRHNNEPKLEDITDLNIKEGKAFELQLNASEPDGDPIVFSAHNLPPGSSIDTTTGAFSWHPTYEQSGNYARIVFKVTEKTISNLSVADTISIIVEHVNRSPDLPSIENVEVFENAQSTFVISEGSDPDKEDQHRLMYSVEKLPEGAQFDPETRTFSWTPTFKQSGTYIVDFVLSDSVGGYDREPVTITVFHVDRKPLIDAVEDTTLDENQKYALKIEGVDLDSEDQNKISFALLNLPEGASFDAATQTLSWTPTYDQSGEYPSIIAVMTAGDLRDTTVFNIKVNHVNRTPNMVDIEDLTIDENQSIVLKIDVSDPDIEDNGKLSLMAENLPEGAQFDTETREFSWQPTYEQSGIYQNITFKVSDPSGLFTQKEFSLTVKHVNRSPEIAEASDIASNENEPIEIQLNASDPDQENKGTLTFSSTNIPEGATLDQATGLLKWNPTYEQSGKYDITFKISDGQLSDSTSMVIELIHVNRAPQLASIENMIVNENEELLFAIQGNDEDVEDEGKLKYSAQNLPEGASFDPATLNFKWTSTYEQSGEYSVSFLVEDPSGLSDQKTISISVNHVNREPELQAIEPATVDENQPINVQLSGSDSDKEDEGELKYSIDNLPPGANLDAVSGLISWTPSYEQSGDYIVTATVSDAMGSTSSQQFSITVSHVNRSPKFESVSTQEGTEDSEMKMIIAATDPDNEDSQKLTFTSTNLPQGASLNSSTGEITWTPSFDQSGDYQINMEVTDSFGETDAAQFTVSIANLNRQPEIASPGKQSVKEGQFLTFTVNTTDPDKEDAGKLTLNAANLPEGVSFDQSSGQFDWTPNFEQSGNYEITFRVQDTNNAANEVAVSLNVANINRSPELNSPGGQSVQEGQNLKFNIVADDPDKEDEGLKLSASRLPNGADFDPESGDFKWTPTFDQEGNYIIEFSTKDKAGSSVKVNVSIKVVDVPEPDKTLAEPPQ